MTDFMASPRRQSPAHVDQKRHALELIRPFVPRFEEWNQQAAKASATALSHVSSPSQKASQARVLSSLYNEVAGAYEQFETAVAGAPPHSRIDDVRAAFVRLIAVLEPWRASS